MQKKFPKIHKFIIAFLVLMILGGASFVPVAAAAVAVDTTVLDEETIKIKDVEDLLDLAEKCTLDSWSQGKTVVLQADIYLDDIDFVPIPTFGGTFDGKGHAIIGLDISDSVSPAGLFGVLQEGAVVSNLNVTGNVSPSGESSALGGIVGKNSGELLNCTFTGTVSGTQNVGGIAGKNSYTGIIKNCRVNGVILGESMTGGIAGYNQGTLTKCKNDADVNNISVEPSVSMEDINLDISMDVTDWSSTNILNAAMDSGGIAGYSTGIIKGCNNGGTIGYPHIGYNLGGIAGRSCGYIADCTNDGEIYGRKDVGGIVGQMEPYVLVELSESGIGELQRELSALDGMLTDAESHMDAGSASVQRRVQKIQTYVNAIRTSLEETIEEVQEQEDSEVNEDTEQSPEGAFSGFAQNRQLTELRVDMDLLLKQLQLLSNEAMSSVGTLGEDIVGIANQANVVSNTFESVMREAEDLALSDFVADISTFNIEEATYGKVVNCENAEAVYADVNVGGIAGNISMEYELDPEDDVTMEFSMKERRQYELTAIIYKSVNNAAVTAKKNYAGGICGRMDLGLVANCEGYGYVSSASGDYVGGIAGLTGSTIRNSFTKCSLSGRKYIGGIVGAGITEDATGESSLVSQCYSLVDILGYQQFAGAVAGIDAGQYVECYFVAEDLPGINRISYADKAEPISYEELLEVKDLPKEFESFTLSFVADGNVVFATTFEYGDSFDEDIFPEVPVVNGNHGQWDVQELKNLQKDTVVTAVYAQFVSTLASEETRDDGRPIFFAEGRFGEGDGILAEEKVAGFEPEEVQSFWQKLNSVEVLEQWKLEIPDDGLLIHTLRYLPLEAEADELDIYIRQDGDWKLAERDPVGSYLLFNIAGTDAEIAVVATTNMWWIWLAGAVAACTVIAGGIWMVCKKKDILKWFIWILGIVLCACAILLLVVLLNGKLLNGVEAYKVLEDYLAQPKQAMKLEVQAELSEEQYTLEAEVLCTELEGKQVTCIETSGARFFYEDGVLYLENGNAYQASEVSADYGNMLEQVATLYEILDIETVKEETDKRYQITVQEEYAQNILEYLLPSVAKDALEMQTLEAEMLVKEDTLESITFNSQGKLQNAEKSKYDIEAELTVLEEEDVNIQMPIQVQEAILSENTEIQAIITTDVFRLYHAWRQVYQQNPLGAQIYLSADCGPLTLDEDVTFISALVEDTRINCVRKNDFSVYFNEDTICSEKGYSVTTTKAAAVDAADLLGIAYELCLQGDFRCTEVNDTYIYSIVLDEAGMKEIAALIAKESADMAIQFENGSVQLMIEDNQLDRIRFACDGELDILLTKVAVALSAELELEEAEKYRNFMIPEKVLDVLTK